MKVYVRELRSCHPCHLPYLIFEANRSDQRRLETLGKAIGLVAFPKVGINKMSVPTFPSFPDQTEWSDDQLISFNEEFKKSSDIVLKAQRRAIEDKLTSYYKKMIDEEQYETFHPCNIVALKTLHKTKKIADDIIDVKQGKNPYCFFTINLKPEKSGEDEIYALQTDLQNFAKKCKYLQAGKYIYSIEQRSEHAEKVHGLHVHIFFEKGENAPSKLQRAFQNKFYDGWVATPAAIDYRYVGENKKEEKIAYVLGMKAQPKMEKVLKDRKIKDAYKVKWYYQQGFDDEIKKITEDEKLLSFLK